VLLTLSGKFDLFELANLEKSSKNAMAISAMVAKALYAKAAPAIKARASRDVEVTRDDLKAHFLDKPVQVVWMESIDTEEAQSNSGSMHLINGFE